MAGEWRDMQWGDLATLEYGKGLRGYEDGAGPYPVFGTNGRIGSHAEPLCRHPTVVIGRKGAYRGVHYAAQPCFVIDTAFYLKPRAEFDMRWAYYELVTHDINSMDSGSAIPSTSRDAFYRLPVRVPPLSEQRAIAHILGALDDKIELNRRMSETLEAMARVLFKAWFVDFEPVRAKIEGRWRKGESLAGLPAHLYDLFPDRLVDSELGEIPEAWEVARVDDEFDLTMGQSPPGETYNEAGDGMPFYQGRADFGARFPRRRVFCTAPTRLAKAGDTLVTVRAPVGDINMASEDCAIGRGVAAVRHKSGGRSYTFQFMRGLEHIFNRFEAEGTVFGSISKRDFHGIRCVAPESVTIAAFERLTAPLEDRIEQLAYESSTLEDLRDTLLPKLISGDLRIKGAEKFIGGAV